MSAKRVDEIVFLAASGGGSCQTSAVGAVVIGLKCAVNRLRNEWVLVLARWPFCVGREGDGPRGKECSRPRHAQSTQSTFQPRLDPADDEQIS